jgi:transcriptional regulator with XRE-family HTH domain
MYRERVEEIRKEKGMSNKQLSEASGVSIDTLSRIVHPENPEKDSPKVNTLQDVCNALGVEIWEIFYTGSTSLANLQAEINLLKGERDTLIAEKAVLEAENARLHGKLDTLKDQMIEVLMRGK